MQHTAQITEIRLIACIIEVVSDLVLLEQFIVSLDGILVSAQAVQKLSLKL